MTSRTAMPLDYSRLDGSAFSRERLRTLSVVVIGAGALGNEVVKALGLLGAGAATLIDFDRVEPSDLTRSTLLRDRRFAGAYKAESLAEAAGGLFPDMDFSALSRPVADAGLGALERAALWFSCVDNDAARLEIAYLSTKLDRPVVDGGLGGTRSSHGRVTWFPGRAGACCGCRLRPSVRREILSSWTSDRLSCTRPATATGEVLPSTPTMAAIVGSMQVEIGLGRLFGSEPGQALSIEITLAPEAKLEEIEIPRSADCLFHEPAGELIAWPQDRPFTELLEGRGNGAAVALDWPVCLEARCAACDHEWRPYGRAALVARTPCPACSAQKAYASESLEAIRPGSEWAARTGGDLRLPDDHLYTVVSESSAR